MAESKFLASVQPFVVDENKMPLFIDDFECALSYFHDVDTFCETAQIDGLFVGRQYMAAHAVEDFGGSGGLAGDVQGFVINAA